MARQRVAVLGGGMAGLTSAYHLFAHTGASRSLRGHGVSDGLAARRQGRERP